MKILSFLLVVLLFSSCQQEENTSPPPPPAEVGFMRGADLSFLPEIENSAGFCYWGWEFIAFKGPDALDGSLEKGWSPRGWSPFCRGPFFIVERMNWIEN